MVTPRYPRLPIGTYRRNEIADYLGTTRKSMSLWCRGLSRPSQETLLRILDFLNLDTVTSEVLQLSYGYVPAGLRTLAKEHPAILAEALSDLWQNLDRPIFSRNWSHFRQINDAAPPGHSLSILSSGPTPTPPEDHPPRPVSTPRASRSSQRR